MKVETLATGIVKAYLNKNVVEKDELATIVANVTSALRGLKAQSKETTEARAEAVPSVTA
jgi:predicted transcriptional regulator